MTKMLQAADTFRNELLPQLLPLESKPARTSFLAQRPELLKADVVSRVTDLVREQAKVRHRSSLRARELAVTIAHSLGNQTSVAQSVRAMGNALHISGRNRSAPEYHGRAPKILLKRLARAEWSYRRFDRVALLPYRMSQIEGVRWKDGPPMACD